MSIHTEKMAHIDHGGTFPINWQSIKMMGVNINALKDKSLDVDPDLRFMALEDFRKYLSTQKGDVSNKAIESFISVLFRLLKDENSYVQNSAVKTFEPIIGFISDEALIGVVKELFSLAVKDQQDGNQGLRTFTTSIPTMTLKSLLNSPILLDKKRICRRIMDFIIPQTLSLPVTIDVVEILVDLTKNLSFVLTEGEVYNFLMFLMGLIMNHRGIISKRVIASFQNLFNHVKDADIKAKILRSIQADSDVLVKFQLYSIVFKNKVAVSPAVIEAVFREVLAALEISHGSIDFDDFDFDSLMELNVIREQSLTLITDMLDCLHSFYDDIFDIILFFLNYNPLKRDDIDEDLDSDDDIQFEDDDVDDGDDLNFGDDDNSWKLRLKSCEILQQCIAKSSLYASKLDLALVSRIPVDDINDLVSTEALRTYISIVNSFSTCDDERFEFIKSKVSAILAAKANLSQFPTIFLLIKAMNRFQDVSIVSDAFIHLNSLKIASRGSSDYLSFYNNVLDVYVEKGALSDTTVDYITNDLIFALEEKGISVLTETIRTLKKLLKNPNSISISPGLITDLKDALISKVSNSRSYSSDFVQNCIDVVAVLATTIVKNDNEIVDKLWGCLNNAILSKATLEALLLIYTSDGDIGGEISLLELSTLITKGDETTYTLALDLAYLVIPKTSQPSDVIIDSILKRKGANDIDRIYKVLNLIFVSSQISSTQLEETIQFSSSLLNSGSIGILDDSFFEFLGNVSKVEFNLFYELSANLDISLESSSKCLAITCIGSQLFAEVEKAEESLLLKGTNYLFKIQFLGYVGKFIPFKALNPNVFFKLLNDEEDDSTKEAIAVAIGNISSRILTEGLDSLLQNFSITSEKNSIHLITSFRLILPDCNKDQLELIWKKVWSETQKLEFDHSISFQLRSIGDLLGDIVVENIALIYPILEKYYDNAVTEFNFTEIYTISVVLKQLINKLDKSEESLLVLEKLISISSLWTDLFSIDIRQLLIGNFLTALHTKPSIILSQLQSLILPQLYKQLTAEVNFKKIIPMGPSQYILDEGLEIRKLTYEFLYTVLSLSTATLSQYDISIYEIGSNIVNQGLVDDQNDIIVLSCINIVNLLNNHEQEFVDVISLAEGEILINIVNGLNVSLNKKLSPKASSQETENHQERIKAVAKLSKRLARSIDTVPCTLSPTAESSWQAYIKNLQTKYAIYYLSSEDS